MTEFLNERDLNKKWFQEHREQMFEEHPKSWVAVSSGEVVGSGNNQLRLIDDLNERGIDRRKVFIGSTAIDLIPEYLRSQRGPIQFPADDPAIDY